MKNRVCPCQLTLVSQDSIYLKIANALYASMDAPLCDLIAAGNDARIDDFTEQALAAELMQIIQKYFDNR